MPAASVASSGTEAPAAAPTGQVQASITPGQETITEPSAAPRTLGTVPAEQSGDAALSLIGTPEEQYQAAFGLLEEARYEEAHEAFSRFIDANPTDDLAQNAAYWRAESLYARQMYPEAAKSYALNLRQYPEGRKAPDNMVKLGIALLKLGRSEEACRAFEQLDQAFSRPAAQHPQGGTAGTAPGELSLTSAGVTPPVAAPRIVKPESADPGASAIDAAAFEALVAPLGPFEPSPRIAAAVSGGPDSLALCLLADRWARAREGTAYALTVDHRLRPESAPKPRRCGAGSRPAE